MTNMRYDIDLQQVYLLQSEAHKDKTLTFICEYFRHHGRIKHWQHLLTNRNNLDLKLSLFKKGRHPLLSSNSPRLHLPGIIPPLRSPAVLQDCEVWGEPPVGHSAGGLTSLEALVRCFTFSETLPKTSRGDVFFKTSLEHRIVKQKVRCFKWCLMFQNRTV